MICLVTGAAGFIGSHLCERLLADGHEVRGLDCFVPYYPQAIKRTNLERSRSHAKFAFHEKDLRNDPLDAVLEGVEGVYHLAAMPGLAQSWTEFDLYNSCNVTATQRLLEGLRVSKSLKRMVYTSTSSVYGKFASGDEALPARPISPYGVTKLAGEQLCRAYADSFDLPAVVLRFFSVYGPRQRPDMGYHKFIDSLLKGTAITVFGDGLQVRGNTYIDDAVDAAVRMMRAPVNETFNVGGGEMASVWDIIGKLESISGLKFSIRTEPARPGDQRHTFADTTKLRKQLGWDAGTTLDEGLARQFAWQQKGLEARLA